MKTIRHRAAAALFAASFAANFASPAFAAGQQGPGAPGPEDGHHGFGGHGPGMGGPQMPFGMHEDRHEDMHGGMHGFMFEHLHRLNLSEAQRDQLFNIRHAAEPEQREHMKAIRKAHEALAELVRADHFDDARAAALARELGQAIAAEALLQARTAAKAMAVLTPEQREQLRRRRTPGPQMRPGQRPPQDAPAQQGRP